MMTHEKNSKGEQASTKGHLQEAITYLNDIGAKATLYSGNQSQTGQSMVLAYSIHGFTFYKCPLMVCSVNGSPICFAS